MKINGVWQLLGAIILVALVTTLVSHSQTPGVINASGNAFSGVLRAAMGK